MTKKMISRRVLQRAGDPRNVVRPHTYSAGRSRLKQGNVMSLDINLSNHADTAVYADSDSDLVPIDSGTDSKFSRFHLLYGTHGIPVLI